MPDVIDAKTVSPYRQLAQRERNECDHGMLDSILFVLNKVIHVLLTAELCSILQASTRSVGRVSQRGIFG